MDQNEFIVALREIQGQFIAATERQLERFVEAANAQTERHLRSSERYQKTSEKIANALLQKLPIEQQELQALRAVREDMRAVFDRLESFEKRLETEGVLRHADTEILAAKVDAARAEVREISGVHDVHVIQEEARRRQPTSVPPPEAGKVAWTFYVLGKIPWKRLILIALLFLAFSVLSHPVQLALGKYFNEVSEPVKEP